MYAAKPTVGEGKGKQPEEVEKRKKAVQVGSTWNEQKLLNAAISIDDLCCSAWNSEELKVLKDAYAATSLTDPNFWTHVADTLNTWRKEMYEQALIEAKAKLPKKESRRRSQRKNTVSETSPLEIIPILQIRTDKDCQSRWFEVSCLLDLS